MQRKDPRKDPRDPPNPSPRDHKPDPGRGRDRPRHLKKVLVVVLILLLAGDLLPLVVGDVSPDRPSSSYGVEREMAALQDKRHSGKWGDIVSSEAEGDLGSIDIAKADRPEVSIEETVVIMGPSPPPDPTMYNNIETTTLPDRLTLIEFLVSRPSAYYVYTKTGNHSKWSEGMVRPSMDFNENGTLVDWERWVEVDVDDDPSTGEENGFDVRARLDIQFNSLELIPPRLFPFRPAQAKIDGGIRLEVEKFSGPNATSNLPMKIFFVKSFSYTGNNYIWMLGFEWQDMPNRITTTVTAAEITAQRPQLDPNPFNLSLFDEASVMDIQGPYDIDIDMDRRSPDMTITLGNARVFLLQLEERIWGQLRLNPADGLDRIPENIHLNLESPSFNKSFDRLEWTSTAPVDFEGTFKQREENTTYAVLTIDDMPDHFLIELDDIESDAEPEATSVLLETSEPISIFDYTEYEFYGDTTENFTHSHFQLRDLPTRLYLNGTFEIGGEDEPPPSNLALGFAANLVDSMMIRLMSKLYRIANTLRTIPNNIIDMPEKNGWVDLQVAEGDRLGVIEFLVSSNSRIEAEGDYIAFRNDTMEIAPPSENDAPLINSSMTARITDIVHMNLDFTNGTVVDMDVEGPRPLRVLFLDNGNDARATLNIMEVPDHFYLRFHPNDIRLSSSEPLQTVSYTSLVGDQYFRFVMEGVPEDLEISQAGGGLVLDTPEGSSLDSFYLVVTDRRRMNVLDQGHNHIYLDRTGSSYFTSIRLNKIAHLDMETEKGGVVNADFSEERDLYIFLTDAELDVETRMLFKPFPSNFSIELPKGFTISGIRLPNVLDVPSIFAFSPIILQMSMLGEDIVKMATELTSNIAEQLGSIGSNTTIKLRSKVPTVLIADMRQGPADEVDWVHGINVNIEDEDIVRARIYMRLPKEAEVTTTSRGDIMDMEIDLKDFDPMWEFLDIRIRGMADRDLSVYLDGLTKEPQDLYLDAYLFTNMTPGTGRIMADVDLTAKEELGPLYISMRKGDVMDSITTLFMSSVPRRLDCRVNVSDRMVLEWDASAMTRNLLVQVQKEVDGEWYDVLALLNRLPARLTVTAGTASGFRPDMDGSPLQGLPEISVTGSTATLSIYLYMDGAAMGMPSTYEIHMRDVPDGTFTTYDRLNEIYKVRSAGIGFIYIRIIHMPYSEELLMDEAELFVEDLYSADIQMDRVFGTYPIIELSDLDAGSFQLRTEQRMDLFGQQRRASIIYVDISTRDGIPWATQLTRNGIQATGGDHHLVVPAPVATLVTTLLSGG